MCGQFFVMGKIYKNDNSYVSNMFVMDSVRGQDSCGLVAVPTVGGRVNTFKKAVLPHDFLDFGKYNKLLNNNNKVLMGHNRWATKGYIDNKSAHPFTHGNITGMHNGTLFNQALLPDHKKFSVDSENIIYSINKEGIENTWKNIDGAAALVWYDIKTDTLNIIRNKERPFFYAFSTKGDSVYGSSEKHIMIAALERNNISYKGPIELPVNECHTFTIDKEDKVQCHIKKLSPYQKVSKVITLSGPAGGKRVDFRVINKSVHQYYDYYWCQDNESDEKYFIEDFQRDLQLNIDDMATGAPSPSAYGNRTRINASTVRMDSTYEWGEDEVDDTPPVYLASTCGWCDSVIRSDEKYFTDGNTVICEECSSDEDVKVYLSYGGQKQ